MDTILGGPELIDYGASLIKKGEIVAFPTETVYGLGASAYNEDAVKKIFIAKGRPQDNPLIVHISSPIDAAEIAIGIPDEAYVLWEIFSPGPLTLVLNKSNNIPDIVTAGYKTVGLRIPNNEIALSLINKSGLSLAAPSANISGRVSPTEAMHVYKDLHGRIPLIIDGGQCTIGIESTVLDLTKNIPIILRPGFITPEQIAESIGKVINHKGEIIKAESPGMKYSHYMPNCPCVSAVTTDSACELYDKNKNAIILGTNSFVESCGSRAVFRLGDNPSDCMKNIFKALRDSEELYSFIIIESFRDKHGYFALHNRLSKATKGITY
ncbi:MAG: L-threonylcarbamoyladenylate synthase [Clostridia bacterium]|jgi:L-threonylcarbamoyladenylate synthase|nr:L-threonylcarbamoyladenylate synthase [Clostridia bacterium]